MQVVRVRKPLEEMTDGELATFINKWSDFNTGTAALAEGISRLLVRNIKSEPNAERHQTNQEDLPDETTK